MRSRRQVRVRAAMVCGLAGLFVVAFAPGGSLRAAEEPTHSAALDKAIIAAAKRHGVPESLVRRIIMRESKYNARARNRNFWGLMQISYPTAQSMGFKGTREQLLDPFVNLKYAVPYLANAFLVAGKQEDAAVRLYAAGYYFTARSRGLLNQLRTADSAPLRPEAPVSLPAPLVLAANAVAQAPQSIGIFGALFGPGHQPDPPPQPAVYAADTSSQGAGPGQGPMPNQATPALPDTSVAMVATANGDRVPPPKWARDGGTTLMARGEQSADQMADRSREPAAVPRQDVSARQDVSSRKTARGRPHKFTQFAELDPPAAAQAYSGRSEANSRFDATASQVAIQRATGGEAPPQTDETPPDTRAALTDDVLPSDEPSPAKRSHPHPAKRRAASHIQQAAVDKPDHASAAQ